MAGPYLSWSCSMADCQLRLSVLYGTMQVHYVLEHACSAVWTTKPQKAVRQTKLYRKVFRQGHGSCPYLPIKRVLLLCLCARPLSARFSSGTTHLKDAHL